MAESLLQPAWLDSQGRREGRYVVGPLLGHGAMGDVHEAWDIVLARPVALKILQHLEPAAMIRFMHEAQLHARLDNPNICRIYDVDASNGTPRIAMQLIRGPTLEDAAPDLQLEEVLGIFAQVADAVHGAHQLNLIHRDIKPSNILLQWKPAGGWTPYICDFSLAMALDGPSVTQPLAMTGTPAYMAPEQVRGDRAMVGPPTDVYGIGSTLYFTLVGRPPCVSTSTAEMLRVKRERRFPAPRSLEPEIPPALEAILFKCMEPAPADRFASAAELAEALRGVQAAPTAPPAEIPERRLATWLRARRTALAALAAAVGLIGAAALLAAPLLRQRNRREEVIQTLALEATSLEQSIRNERLLPLHDLRPADNRTRARMAALRARAGSLGPAAAGPLSFTLGQAHFLLRDLSMAEAELEKAWSAGYQTADAAFLLAQVHYETCRSLAARAAYLGQPPPPRAGEARAQAAQFLLLARPQTRHPREYLEALEESLNGNAALAAQEAQEALKANPWHLQSAILGSECLVELARQRLDGGDADGAEGCYQQALDLARNGLAMGQSEPRLHHAAAMARIGLAAASLECGDLTQTTLEELERTTDQTLRLDPGNPDAQSDWLQARTLQALRQMGLGQDPRQALDQALQFYWARTREPRSLDLRMDHLALYWLLAERDFDRGEEAGPAITEAMKDPGHATTRFRDFQGDLLNLKARYEASRGQDPRPTLESVVAQFEPAAQQPVSAIRCGIAAKAWLVRAEWELQQRIDAMTSIRRAQALLKRALESTPTSARIHALLGQSQVLESRARPDERKALRARAGEHLRWSKRLNPADREMARLQGVLAR